MSKAIISVYAPSTEHHFLSDLETQVLDAMDIAAGHYKEHNGEADFIVIYSPELGSIIGGSQCFFEYELKEALKKNGYENIEVRAICSHSGRNNYDHVAGFIREKGDGSVQFLDNFRDVLLLDKKLGGPVVYQIIKK